MPRPEKERIGNEEQLAHEIASLLKTEHRFVVMSVHAQPGRVTVESRIEGRNGMQAFKSLERRLLQTTNITAVSAFVNFWNKEAQRVETTHRFVFSSPEIIQHQDAILDILKPHVSETAIRASVFVDPAKFKDKPHGRHSNT